MKKVEIRYAESLSEVYGQVEEIAEKVRNQNAVKRPLFWFRGVSNTNHNLEPNIFRGADYVFNEKKTYYAAPFYQDEVDGLE